MICCQYINIHAVYNKKCVCHSSSSQTCYKRPWAMTFKFAAKAMKILHRFEVPKIKSPVICWESPMPVPAPSQANPGKVALSCSNYPLQYQIAGVGGKYTIQMPCWMRPKIKAKDPSHAHSPYKPTLLKDKRF